MLKSELIIALIYGMSSSPSRLQSEIRRSLTLFSMFARVDVWNGPNAILPLPAGVNGVQAVTIDYPFIDRWPNECYKSATYPV